MTSGRRSRQQRAAGLRVSTLPPADIDGYHVKHEFMANANRAALRSKFAKHTRASLRKPSVGIANSFKQRVGVVLRRPEQETLAHMTQSDVYVRRARNRMRRHMRRSTRQAQR
jgi:hypothetical protein